MRCEIFEVLIINCVIAATTSCNLNYLLQISNQLFSGSYCVVQTLEESTIKKKSSDIKIKYVV